MATYLRKPKSPAKMGTGRRQNVPSLLLLRVPLQKTTPYALEESPNPRRIPQAKQKLISKSVLAGRYTPTPAGFWRVDHRYYTSRKWIFTAAVRCHISWLFLCVTWRRFHYGRQTCPQGMSGRWGHGWLVVILLL